jgi:hypothetical protein
MKYALKYSWKFLFKFLKYNFFKVLFLGIIITSYTLVRIDTFKPVEESCEVVASEGDIYITKNVGSIITSDDDIDIFEKDKIVKYKSMNDPSKIKNGFTKGDIIKYKRTNGYGITLGVLVFLCLVGYIILLFDSSGYYKGYSISDIKHEIFDEELRAIGDRNDYVLFRVVCFYVYRNRIIARDRRHCNNNFNHLEIYKPNLEKSKKHSDHYNKVEKLLDEIIDD